MKGEIKRWKCSHLWVRQCCTRVRELESKLESLLESKLGKLVNQRAPSFPLSSQERNVATIFLICDSHTHETLYYHLISSYPDFIQEYVNQVGVYK